MPDRAESTAAASIPEPERPHFDMVLRGYDRIEVDRYIDAILQQNTALRRELERRPTAAQENGRAEVAEARPTRPPSPTPVTPQYGIETPAEDSFGFRAEKLLRLAEREAAEMRARATRDAESAEATARRRADEQLRAAEREADEARSRAAQEVVKLKKQAAQEAARLGHLYRSTKEELRRLAELLNAEVARPDPEEVTVPADEPEQAGAPQGAAASGAQTAYPRHVGAAATTR